MVFGRPFVKWFALFYRAVVLSVCSVLSVVTVTLVYCGQTAGQINMKPGMQVGLGLATVLDGDPGLPPPMGHTPHTHKFSAYICCGQMARWIKMPLLGKIGLHPRDIVLDRPSSPSSKMGHSLPIFRPCLLWQNGCMDQDVTWYKDRPRPRPHCVTWGPSSPSQKGHSFQFWAHVIVAKRSTVSATAEHSLQL